MMEELIRGEVLRPYEARRLDRRTSRDLARTRSMALIDQEELRAKAEHADARINNGVQLAMHGVAGISMLDRAITIQSRRNELLEGELRLIQEAVAYGVRDVVYNYINGTFR
jgi:hypothetical protein